MRTRPCMHEARAQTRDPACIRAQTRSKMSANNASGNRLLVVLLVVAFAVRTR